MWKKEILFNDFFEFKPSYTFGKDVDFKKPAVTIELKDFWAQNLLGHVLIQNPFESMEKPFINLHRFGLITQNIITKYSFELLTS